MSETEIYLCKPTVVIPVRDFALFGLVSVLMLVIGIVTV